MNAVERLLDHAEQVEAFFDEALGPCRDSGDPQAVCMLAEMLAAYAGGGPFAPNELTDGPPYVRGILTQEDLNRMEQWPSEDALGSVVERVVAAAPQRHGRGSNLAREALAAFCHLLAERERLLSPEPVQEMLQGVFTESLHWGEGAGGEVRDAATAVASALERLLPEPGRDPRRKSITREPVRCREEWASEKENHLRPAVRSLRLFACPPLSRESGSSPRRSQRRSSNPGGRRKKYPPALRQQLMKDRKKEERKRKPQPLKEWLTEWATEHDMKRSEVKLMYEAEQAAIRRARSG